MKFDHYEPEEGLSSHLGRRRVHQGPQRTNDIAALPSYISNRFLTGGEGL